MLNKTYTINESKAISETIDGETIIVNLDTGFYYSVNETATIIWNKLQENNSLKNISHFFLNHYDVEKDTLEKYMTQIISLFLKDDLILESEPDGSPDSIENPTNIKRETFLIPKIERYDDMARALRSDPVHDVNEEGWPNLK
jgi:hypothetical protein